MKILYDFFVKYYFVLSSLQIYMIVQFHESVLIVSLTIPIL